MFFRKRTVTVKREEDVYQKYPDSLTGHLNASFAFCEYGRVKDMPDMGAVMVSIPGCDELPHYKAVEYIRNAGGLVSRICKEKIIRLQDGDFLVFSKDYKRLEERLDFFLREFKEGEKLYAVASDAIDSNESFEQFVNRIRRHTGTVAVSNAYKSCNLVKNT